MISFKIIFLEEFGKAFVPKRIRPHLRSYFLKAGITEVPYRLFGALFYLALFVTFILYLWRIEPGLSAADIGLLKTFIATVAVWTVLPLAIFSLLALLLYFYLDLRIFNRTKAMEAVLPDFLRFLSGNLKGGMPFERAMWSSMRPEFGILSNEVRLAAKRVMTGQDVEEALRDFTSKYDSPMLRRSFDLVIEGIKGGGQIADLIDRVVENLEETRELKAEMSTTNLTYVIFIFIIVIVVAPVLFTLSFYFMQIIQGFGQQIGSAEQAQTVLPFDFGKFKFDLDVFRRFSQYSLAVLSLFSAGIVSIINRGSIRGGIKYFPVFLILSQLAYFLFLTVGSGVFGTLLGP